MTPKGKKGLKEIWKRDEEDPNLINLTNQNGDIDDEVLILDSILTARIHPHRLHPSELVEGNRFLSQSKMGSVILVVLKFSGKQLKSQWRQNSASH